MTPPSDPHKEPNTEKNQPHITPSFDIYTERFSEISEHQFTEKNDSDNDDHDSFGDLILFI
jgi:hypothetical protein